MRRPDGASGRRGRGAAGAWLGVVILAVLSGCANGPTSTVEELGEDANTIGFGRRYPHDPTENEFTFGPGDEVLLAHPDLPALPPIHVIRSDGKVTLPLLNDIEAAGLTTEQLRVKLVGLLAVYLKQPELLAVSVGTIVSKNYFVAAQNPATGGTVIQARPFVGDTTVFDVFVQAGSPSSPLDDDCNVKVIRGDPRNPRVLTVNLRELFLKGYTGANIRIQPDDIVYVPSTFLGQLNTFISGIAAPFQGLFRVTTAAYEIDAATRLIQGGDVGRFRRTRVF